MKNRPGLLNCKGYFWVQYLVLLFLYTRNFYLWYRGKLLKTHTKSQSIFKHPNSTNCTQSKTRALWHWVQDWEGPKRGRLWCRSNKSWDLNQAQQNKGQQPSTHDTSDQIWGSRGKLFDLIFGQPVQPQWKQEELPDSCGRRTGYMLHF